MHFFNIKIVFLINFYFIFFKKNPFHIDPYPNFSLAPSSSSKISLSLFSRSLPLVPHNPHFSLPLSSQHLHFLTPLISLPHTHTYLPTSIAHVKFRLQHCHYHQHYRSIFLLREGNWKFFFLRKQIRGLVGLFSMCGFRI